MGLADILAEAARPDLDGFLARFYQKHPSLRQYEPKVVEKAGGGSGGHPEARQHGNEVWLFPKFWKLNAKTRDFVFAHELGHYALSRKSLGDLVNTAGSLGIDLWDPDSLPFGQFNMEEAFADAFATYHLNKSELKRRYPAWVKLVEKF